MKETQNKSVFVSGDELTLYIADHPEEFIEKSKILAREFRTGTGIIDALLLDENNTLWVLEAKTHPDDKQLLQTIQYYDWVTDNLDIINKKFGDKTRGSIEDIGIILVAPSFTNDLSRLSNHLKIRIRLVAFHAFQTSDGSRRILVGEDPRQAKPPPIDITLVVMTYMLITRNIEPSLEKIGIQLKGIYSPQKLYDTSIRLAEAGILHIGINYENEHGVSISEDGLDFARELYNRYWKRLKTSMESRRDI